MLGSIFGGVAITIIIMVTILAVKIARRGTSGPNGLVLLALRYAFVATAIGFAAGIWTSLNQGRFTGAEGNILPLHALGFHALQAIPLVAWLFSRSVVPEREARLWIHSAGAAWIVACVALAWQTAAGRPVTEPSLAMLLAVAVWLFWLASAVRAVLAWRAARGALAPGAFELDGDCCGTADEGEPPPLNRWYDHLTLTRLWNNAAAQDVKGLPVC